MCNFAYMNWLIIYTMFVCACLPPCVRVCVRACVRACACPAFIAGCQSLLADKDGFIPDVCAHLCLDFMEAVVLVCAHAPPEVGYGVQQLMPVYRQ